MKFLDKAYRFLWKKVEENDQKRMVKQKLPDGITAIIDIPYMDDGKKEHLLDVYYPEDAKEALPTIIDIHGGGLMYAYKELNKNYNYHLAKKGFTVISISYSLSPNTRFPTCLLDVAAALTWIGDNLDNYPCDKDKVFITGDSAGAFLAAHGVLLATSEELREFYGVAPINIDFKAAGYTSGMFQLDSSIAKFLAPGIMGKGGLKKSKYAPVLEFADIIDKGKMPPCYLVTSKEDMIQSPTLYFKALLDQKGIKNRLDNYPKGGPNKLEHVFSVLYPEEYQESVDVIDAMTNFFLEQVQ